MTPELNDVNKALDFIHVEDVAEIITRVLSRSNESEIINVGSGHPTSISSLIDVIANTMSIDFKNIFPKIIDEKNKSWADTQKVSEKFNFRTETSMQERISELINGNYNVKN